jgi:hypothetical protein
MSERAGNKLAVALFALGFGITLAYLMGQRMSQDAMAVVIGVAVGVAASVPMSVLLVALLLHDKQTDAAQPPVHQLPHKCRTATAVEVSDVFDERGRVVEMGQDMGDEGVRWR